MRLVIVSTHPIQYQAPLFRSLSIRCDLHVIFMMRQTAEGNARSGFRVKFEWDVPLLDGYRHSFANNNAPAPSSDIRGGIVLTGVDQLLGARKADVLMVLGWFPKGYLQVIDWAHSNGVPLVGRGESNRVSAEGRWKEPLRQVFFRHLFSKFRAFATIGQRNREFYRHYGVGESKLYAAPYSVDTPFFESEFGRYRPSRRQRGKWRIGFVGKLTPKKRPIDLVRAIALSRSKASIELVIIGDGPLREELVRTADDGKVTTEIRGFLNQSEIVAKGYADLDAIVLPSGYGETWGLVINEAMTGGIPAIVSDLVGCGPDLIDEGETGYVFPVGSVEELARAVDRLVEQLESGRDFSPAVRSKIAHYSIDRTVEGVLAALEGARR